MIKLYDPHPTNYARYSASFRSPGELLKFVESNLGLEYDKGYSYGSRWPAGMARNCATVEKEGSFMPLTLMETMQRVKLGWPEAAEKLKKNKLEIAERLNVSVKKQVWDVTGHSIDVGRMLTGEPECCRRRKTVKDQPKMITLAMNIGVNAYETEQSVLMRLAYVLVLVEQLETLGCRIKIVAYSSLHSKHFPGTASGSVSVTLKDFHETMSSSILAAWCGTITIERRFIWLVWDKLRAWERLGSLAENGACDDRAILQKADVWFPAWDAVPSDELCKGWLYALGFIEHMEWTVKQRRAYSFLTRLGEQLGKPLKEAPAQ